MRVRCEMCSLPRWIRLLFYGRVVPGCVTNVLRGSLPMLVLGKESLPAFENCARGDKYTLKIRRIHEYVIDMHVVYYDSCKTSHHHHCFCFGGIAQMQTPLSPLAQPCGRNMHRLAHDHDTSPMDTLLCICNLFSLMSLEPSDDCV